MVYAQIIFDIHSNSFIQIIKLYLSYNLQSFISQILKVAGLLAKMFKLFILLGIHIEMDIYYLKIKIKLHSLRTLKQYLDNKNLAHDQKNINLLLYCTEF